MKIILFFTFFLMLQVSIVHSKQLTVGTSHWVGFSPINVADAKGFWKEQGLDVRVLNYLSGIDANNAFKQKKVEIVIDMLGNWIGLYQEGVNLKILGEADWSHGGDKIIAKKDFDLTKLKGEKVGVYMNLPSVTFFLNKFLKKNNLKLSDVELIEQEPTDLTKYFNDNRLKLIVNYDPYAFDAVQKGNGVLKDNSANYPGVIPEGFAMLDDVYKKMSKDDLKKFYKGWLKAVEWTKNPGNFKEYINIINSKTFEGEKPYPEDEIKLMLASVRIHESKELKSRNKTGIQAFIKEIKDFLNENKLLKRDFKVEDILDVSEINGALN